MRIRSVDVPRALIEAHRNGSLVIFVGAGASRDPPSGLPDFRRLAADIAADASVDEVVGTVIAVAPTIGLARACSAAPELALALGYDVDAALEALENGKQS